MKLFIALAILMTTLTSNNSHASENYDKRKAKLVFELDNLVNNIGSDANRSANPVLTYCYGAGLMAGQGNDAMFLGQALGGLPKDADLDSQIQSLYSIHTLVFDMEALCNGRIANLETKDILSQLKTRMDQIGMFTHRLDR